MTWPVWVLAVMLVVLLCLGACRFFRAPPAPSAPSEGDGYEVYFTTPRYPDKKTDHKGGLDEKLTAFINTASTSVDMAIYQFDLPNVTQALLDAKERGAAVRVVTDIDTLDDPAENASFNQLDRAGVPIVGGNADAIMHDKFVVVDGQSVWTGSWNFTTNDTYRYDNNGILIHSPELARSYTVTFEKMFKDKKFGPLRRPGGTTARLAIGGATVENYFAPEDKVAEKIRARLSRTQKTIDFMAFAFTNSDLGNVVLERAGAGVKVRGVFEKSGSDTRFSQYARMKQAGLDVWQDGNPYLMHHKVFIMDGQTVVLGSYNFSQSADQDNDENLLIVDDTRLAEAFTAEFQRVYEQAKHPPNK